MYCFSKISWVGPLLLIHSEVERIPPKVPGIYLLQSVADGLGGYATFYVGQTEDLRRRLREHLRGKAAKLSIRLARVFGRPYFCAAPVFDAALRVGIEAGLIRALRPICNQQQPDADPVIVQLPPITFII